MMCNDCCVQDVVVVLAPFPNNPNPVDEFDVVCDFDLKGDGLVWYARPQLCTGTPCTGASPPHPLLRRQQHPSNYSLQIQG